MRQTALKTKGVHHPQVLLLLLGFYHFNGSHMASLTIDLANIEL